MKRAMLALLVVSIVFFASCSSVPEFNLLYRLPEPTSALQGKSVALDIVDLRADKNILTRRAREKFQGFSGNVTYSLARYGDEGFKIGVLNLKEALTKSFRERLEATGLKVLVKPAPGVPQLKIYINQLYLDYVDRKWKASMDYDARLEQNGNVLAKQSLSGSAERSKTLGRKGADTVFAELFTDMVNQLDVIKLFKDAKLI